jgi:hypothetical protein
MLCPAVSGTINFSFLTRWPKEYGLCEGIDGKDRGCPLKRMGAGGVESKQAHARNEPRWPWIGLILLLMLCLARGLWLNRGLVGPGYFDEFRDAGFVQGILDGNLFGDPTSENAWRWYPPLIHLLAAAATWASGVHALTFWINAGPWLNLAVPATFFLMARSLLGGPAAMLATAFLVLFNGALMPASVTATYAPWTFTPFLSLPFFFLGVWLVHARVGSGRLTDAALIGGAIGLAILAHPVPAVLLAAITTIAACASHGLRLATLGWLAMACLTAIILSASFLFPLFISYRLHEINLAPSHFIQGLFTPRPISLRLLASFLPGLLALPVIALLAHLAPLDRAVRVILITWIAVPALLLLRHFACGGPVGAHVCTAFVVPIHHWNIYLQAGLACLIGYAAWLLVKRWILAPPQRIRLGCSLAIAAGALGCVVFLARSDDARIRLRALEGIGDVETYFWLVDHTRPQDLVVTELRNDWADPAGLAALAAGRRMVAPPEVFSNPFFPLQPRNLRRLAYLAAAAGKADAEEPSLCDLVEEAGPNADAYVILPNDTPVVGANALIPVFHGGISTIYRAARTGCPSSRS